MRAADVGLHCKFVASEAGRLPLCVCSLECFGGKIGCSSNPELQLCRRVVDLAGGYRPILACFFACCFRRCCRTLVVLQFGHVFSSAVAVAAVSALPGCGCSPWTSWRGNQIFSRCRQVGRQLRTLAVALLSLLIGRPRCCLMLLLLLLSEGCRCCCCCRCFLPPPWSALA